MPFDSPLVTVCNTWKTCLGTEQTMVRDLLAAAGATTAGGRKNMSNTCIDPEKTDVFAIECDCFDHLTNTCGEAENKQTCYHEMMCCHDLICQSWKDAQNNPACPTNCPATMIERHGDPDHSTKKIPHQSSSDAEAIAMIDRAHRKQTKRKSSKSTHRRTSDVSLVDSTASSKCSAASVMTQQAFTSECTDIITAHCGGKPCVDLREDTSHHHVMILQSAGTAQVWYCSGTCDALSASHGPWTCTSTNSVDLVGTWSCSGLYDGTITVSSDYGDDFTAARTNEHMDRCHD